MASRAMAFLTTSTVVILSTSLLRNAASILQPVYGSVPVDYALGYGLNAGLFLSAGTTNIGGGRPRILANTRLLGMVTVCALPALPYLLRLATHAYSLFGLTSIVVVPPLIALFLTLFAGVAMRMGLGVAPLPLRIHVLRGDPLDSSENMFIFAMIVLVPGAYRVLSDTLPILLMKVALLFPDRFIALINHGASRWELQAWLSLALFLIISTRCRLLYAKLVIFQLLAWLPHALWSSSQNRVAAANTKLLPEGFKLMESKESITGYLSVIESTKDGFRVLRNDHSLLGGQWLLTENRRQEGAQIAESIYGVFHMLEAVRLMDPDDSTVIPSTSSPPTALVIGLGIGTAPAALVEHGIHVTAVEIDPVVTDLALRYFGLNPAVLNINQDVVTFVDGASLQSQTFDYVIHDVFTGGEEPEALFTGQFLRQLKTLMAPTGRIALNYAGNLNALSTYEVLARILTIFPYCKLYRDNPPIESLIDSDFANVVALCGRQQWHLRSPVEEDFLHSQTRQEYLVPRHEISREKVLEKKRVLSKSIHPRQNERYANALDHWKIMRKIMPDVVWENW